MPTSAKLVAAIWFALIGGLAANAHVPALPGAGAGGVTTFIGICAVIGLLCGWHVMGKGVDGSYADAVSSGLKTSVVMVFLALLLFSGRQMIDESTRMRFDGPMDAMLGWCRMMMENGLDILTVGVIGVLVLGGIFGGLLAEWAWRRWR